MTWSTIITTAFNNQSFIVREVVGRVGMCSCGVLVLASINMTVFTSFAEGGLSRLARPVDVF